jgi:ankyrin repeat protein
MLLLSKGADPTLVSGEGETAFHLAAMQGKHEIARVLFEMSNEDIFAKDRSGRSLIDKTIENGFKELANNLVLWSYCQLRISTFPSI